MLVDCDPQGNASTGLGADKPKLDWTLFEVLSAAAEGVDDLELSRAVYPVQENLDLIPATLDLAGAEAVLLNSVGKELILRDVLDRVRERYDWIVLDAPPSLGLLTINILAACERVVVPMQCEFYALEGLSQLVKTVDIVRKRINPGLEIGTVLLTMYDPRNRLTAQVSQEVRDYFGPKVAQTMIPRNVRLSESPSFGEAAVVRFPSSKGASAYLDFVDEVLKR